MKKITPGIKAVLIIAVSALVMFLALEVLVKSPSGSSTGTLKQTTLTKRAKTKSKIHYVAIGDSLTFGLGDASESGGYVPLVKSQLADNDDLTIQSDNFGKSGDTSTQVYQRIVKSKEIQQGLAQADLITMTVGANDLMHIIKKDVMNMDLEKVKTGQKVYQKNLDRLIKEIRKYNAKAPLVVASIYNPFYVYFPQITAMKTSMGLWNETTQTVLHDYQQTYYVDIDTVMTQPSGSILAGNKTGKDAYNPYLYTEDHFHPNNRGYQAIAGRFVKKIQSIKANWLYR
ncbi:SGNH/GDSL hydrolase family protein [Lapidilactobacillus luobeiensis]|uniref:SGNH/GDSL hydrolase family protein n=1 Tax=Lapidilactobacillus luobeiensis TaxID=2950371 RepID=UPI0021C3D6E7|nr:SGNH/GDSL hydrolase family protein [Lapidilactobacillus luobeiensis]